MALAVGEAVPLEVAEAVADPVEEAVALEDAVAELLAAAVGVTAAVGVAVLVEATLPNRERLEHPANSRTVAARSARANFT